MKALSVRQPYAWLLIRPDIIDPALRLAALGREIKDVENRPRRTHLRGEFLIHAAKSMTREEYQAAWRALARAAGERAATLLPAFDELPRGGIVGKAEIIDCVPHSESSWFTGEWGCVVRNAQPLPFRAVSGMLGFFEVPA